MSYHLVQRLRRYYRRAANNDIVFRNDMSLNGMAGHMAELGAIGITADSLSRMLRGKDGRRFSHEQLQIFCTVLELSEWEYWELTYDLVRDRCEHIGIDFELTTSPPVVNLLVRNVETLGQAIDEEEFNAAINMLRDLCIAKAELDGEAVPSVPLMRIISLVEIERANLTYALEKSAPSEALWKTEKVNVALAQDLTLGLRLSKVEKRLWQQYYVEGHTAADIASAEELLEATVYAILDSIKSRLLERLVDPDSDQPGR